MHPGKMILVTHVFVVPQCYWNIMKSSLLCSGSNLWMPKTKRKQLFHKSEPQIYTLKGTSGSCRTCQFILAHTYFRSVLCQWLSNHLFYHVLYMLADNPRQCKSKCLDINLLTVFKGVGSIVWMKFNLDDLTACFMCQIFTLKPQGKQFRA